MGGALANWGFATTALAAVGLPRYAVPAFAAVVLAALNLAGVALWLPESLTPERRAEMAQSPRTAFTARAMFEGLRRPRFGPLLNVRFFYSLAFTLFTANFALYTQYRLGLDDQATSYILTYVGLLVVMVQGFAVGKLTDRFSDERLIFGAALLMVPTLLAWAFTGNVPLLLGVLAPLALAGGVLNTVITSAITKSVYPEEIGGALGFSSSLESLTRVLAPALGGYLIDRLGTSSLGLFGALIMAGVVILIWRRLIVDPDPPLPDRGEKTAAAPTLTQS
jgi:DHA1 family tetracycline resistance protein-like MFS transporter